MEELYNKKNSMEEKTMKLNTQLENRIKGVIYEIIIKKIACNHEEIVAEWIRNYLEDTLTRVNPVAREG